MKCPICGSGEVKRLKPAFGNDSLVNPQNFKIRHDLQCQTCRAAWRPPCSRTGAIFYIVAGLFSIAAILGLAIFFLSNSEQVTGGSEARRGRIVLLSALILAPAGLCAIVYGIRVLAGKAGKLAILDGKGHVRSRET